jgi:hypothetical protein
MGICEKVHLRSPQVPSLPDLAGKVPRLSLCVNPYFRPLAALCFAILFTSRSGRTGPSVARSGDFAWKAKPSDSSLARTVPNENVTLAFGTRYPAAAY